MFYKQPMSIYEALNSGQIYYMSTDYVLLVSGPTNEWYVEETSTNLTELISRITSFIYVSKSSIFWTLKDSAIVRAFGV